VQDVELRFRHRAFEAQQQPIIKMRFMPTSA